MNNKFYKNLEKNLSLFEGCGNMLGIVPLTLAGYKGDGDSWKKDSQLRKLLTSWGREIKSDSVMVLLGDPINLKNQGYNVDMAVFEPNGDDGSGLGGNISTMCGNGVRAVAAWVLEFNPGLKEVAIKTMSGLRVIKVEDEQYLVEMGEFTSNEKDLSSYVNTKIVKANSAKKFIDSKIPREVLKDLAKYTKTSVWDIGLNGTREKNKKIDGEPHVVIELSKDEVKDIATLRKFAVAAGPTITKNLTVFPLEICVNFIVVDKKNKTKPFVIWNCTHERNLGSDADHSVTAACGTGSTVAGGFMLTKYLKDSQISVLVKCLGGNLEIMKSKNTKNGLLMKGPAKRVSKNKNKRIALDLN